MPIRGSLDVVTAESAVGWAYAPSGRGPLLVQAMLGHELLGEARADIHRPDLASAGFGDGRCGFAVPFQRLIDPLYFPFIVVRPEGGDVEMPRTATCGFADYFRALHTRYPAAARPRSVHGGLWIDRTDAPQLLRGRLSIGLLEREDATPLGRLIEDGYVVIEQACPGARGGAADGADRVQDAATIVFASPVLRRLRLILEDHPIAVRADLIRPGEQERFTQPSHAEELPAPSECVAVIAAPGGGAFELVVVRGSHRFPEFTADGLSRWTGSDGSVAALAGHAGSLADIVRVPAGGAAILSPGLMYRARPDDGGACLSVLCVPTRSLPARVAQAIQASAANHASGARIWL